jgi:hypothetical protein
MKSINPRGSQKSSKPVADALRPMPVRSDDRLYCPPATVIAIPAFSTKRNRKRSDCIVNTPQENHPGIALGKKRLF